LNVLRICHLADQIRSAHEAREVPDPLVVRITRYRETRHLDVMDQGAGLDE